MIVPTYNRAGLIGGTLDSLLDQSLDSCAYEVIVCDNGSTDNTYDICKQYEVRYPGRVCAFQEPRPGVHFARNRSAVVAKGTILYFTDDDMIADRKALEAILVAFELDDRVAVATGRVLPRWEADPPAWIERHCRNSLLSLHDPSEVLLIAPYDVGVYSCHEAIRADVFRETAGFHPENTAGEWIGDGETGLNDRVRRMGYLFAFIGSSVTYHRIPSTRMTQSYLDKRLANQGNCDSYTAYRRGTPGAIGLLAGMAVSCVKAAVWAIIAAGTWAIQRSRWHLDRARVFYWLQRMRYDFRLLTDPEWRTLVLRDDWLQCESSRRATTHRVDGVWR